VATTFQPMLAQPEWQVIDANVRQLT